METSLLKALDALEDEVCCPICRDTLHEPQMLSGCKHLFCRACFDRALKETKKETCPLCGQTATRRSARDDPFAASLAAKVAETCARLRNGEVLALIRPAPHAAQPPPPPAAVPPLYSRYVERAEAGCGVGAMRAQPMGLADILALHDQIEAKTKTIEELNQQILAATERLAGSHGATDRAVVDIVACASVAPPCTTSAAAPAGAAALNAAAAATSAPPPPPLPPTSAPPPPLPSTSPPLPPAPARRVSKRILSEAAADAPAEVLATAPAAATEAAAPAAAALAVAAGDDVEDEEEDAACAICGNPEANEGDEILFCDGCNLPVHQECYRVPSVPEGEWLCDLCSAQRAEPALAPRCPVCPSAARDLVRTYKGLHGGWAHMSCCYWHEGPGFVDEKRLRLPDGWERIRKGLRDGSLACVFCPAADARNGAVKQCAWKNCVVAFHPTCNLGRALFNDPDPGSGTEARMYCLRHAPMAEREAQKRLQAAEVSRGHAPSKRRGGRGKRRKSF